MNVAQAQTPTFRELFPRLPSVRCTAFPVRQVAPAALLPIDAHGRPLISEATMRVPTLVQLPGASPTNLISTSLSVLRDMYQQEITITDVNPVGLVHHGDTSQLIATARVLGAQTGPPAPDIEHNLECRAADLHYTGQESSAPYYDTEIRAHLRLRTRYRLHRALFAPLRRGVAAATGQRSTGDLAKFLVETIADQIDGGPLIDVACGDSTLALDPRLNQSAAFVVRNDVSCTMALQQQPQNTVTTCLDARATPFANRQFAVALVKNVLHHMPSPRDARALVREALRISRSVVLCEILDPTRVGGRWGRLRHHYYRRYLPDPGDQFLDSNEFDLLVTTAAADTIVRVDYCTINGTYACTALRSR